jgi:hypothetical protein
MKLHVINFTIFATDMIPLCVRGEVNYPQCSCICVKLKALSFCIASPFKISILLLQYRFDVAGSTAIP